jgi:hypothetical protein
MKIKIGQMQEGNESKITEREEENGLKYILQKKKKKKKKKI